MIFTFREWLIKTQAGKNSAIGDLARDVLFDERSASIRNNLDEWKAYLKNSPIAVLETLDRAWRHYVKAVERNRVNRVQKFSTPEASAQTIERR